MIVQQQVNHKGTVHFEGHIVIFLKERKAYKGQLLLKLFMYTPLFHTLTLKAVNTNVKSSTKNQ